MGCCGSLFRGILITLNLVLFAGGLLLVAAGSYLHYQIQSNEEFMDNRGSMAGIAAAVLGGVIALVSFLGCCGLCKRNACMVNFYGICVLLLLVAEIGVGVFAYIKQGEAEAIFNKGMKSSLDKYNTEDPTRIAIVEAWDGIQQELECCGVDTFADWKTSSGWDNTNDVPMSCCKVESEGCGVGSSPDKIYTGGCKAKIVEQFKTHANYVAYAGVGAGVFQLIAVIVAFCLGKRYGLADELYV